MNKGEIEHKERENREKIAERMRQRERDIG